jgi:hypothetical protein
MPSSVKAMMASSPIADGRRFDPSNSRISLQPDSCSTEGFVVGDVYPTSGDIGIADGEDGDGGIIAMEPLGREDVTLKRRQNRGKSKTGRAHGIGHGR